MIIVNQIKNLWKDPFFRKVIIAFIIIKIFILAMGFVGDVAFPLDNEHQRPVTENAFLNQWAQYDGAGYLDVAINGYNKEFNNTGNYSVYPLFPLLILLLSAIPFISPALAAFLIANLFSLIAIILGYVLIRDELGQKQSYRTALLLMLFPTAYFFTAMYAESIFLALILGMFIAAKKDNWLLVGVLGFLTSLTRIQGVIMFLPMLYMYLRSKHFEFGKMNLSVLKPSIILLLLIPLGLAAFLGYHHVVTGDALIQLNYGFGIYDKGLSLPWTPIIDSIEKMFSGAFDSLLYNGANLLAFLGLAAVTYLSYKKLKPEYTIYLLFSILFILISSNLRGIGRYALTMFPIFMIFAMMYDESKLKKYGLIILYIIFLILMTLFVFRHVNQGIYLTFNYLIF
ncbi:hypothetical protein CL614_06240 [archaeon]|nr:hypothetical protein [archaeon]|tara:strand:+ start:1026 stop:2219 length:1194 start_codon:yes stop_codon:yes gene_type:complete